MAFEDLERHLIALGIAPTGEAFAPIDADVVAAIERHAGGRFPDVMTWFFGRFGGSRFDDGALYVDPTGGEEVMIGWFLDGKELADAFEAFAEVLPPGVVPIADDGGDNMLCVGIGDDNRGTVYFHPHDRPRPATYQVAPAIEAFMHSLHREVVGND